VTLAELAEVAEGPVDAETSATDAEASAVAVFGPLVVLPPLIVVPAASPPPPPPWPPASSKTTLPPQPTTSGSANSRSDDVLRDIDLLDHETRRPRA